MWHGAGAPAIIRGPFIINALNVIHTFNIKPGQGLFLKDYWKQITQCYKYLCVLFDEHLTFEKNASVLADSAGRALGLIRTKLWNLKECSYNTFTTLFSSGVLPIADYSAGIWGTKIFSTTEQVQYKAARYFWASIDLHLYKHFWKK